MHRHTIQYLIATIFLAFFALIVPDDVYAEAPTPETTPAQEECSWIGQSMSCFTQILKKSNEGALNKEGSEFATTVNSINSLAIMIGGAWDTSDPSRAAVPLNFQHGALSGLSGSIIAMYTNPPASTKEYALDLGRTLGFIPRQAMAQGIGFSGLSPLLPLWKVFRDISYGILAVILIAVGLMVMFRKKIDPKTVVTVQNSIPRIVVALLLVTFSYAIVGLVIDGMYLLIALIISMISSATGDTIGNAMSLSNAPRVAISATVGDGTVGTTLTNVSDAVLNNNLVNSLLDKIGVNLTYTTKEATDMIFNGGLWGMTKFFFGSGLNAWDDIGAGVGPGAKIAGYALTGILGFLIGGTKGLVAGLTIFSGPGLLVLIILLVLLFGFIRIVFMLIDAYINIIISLLTAPFQLALEAIPGSTSFSSWFRHLLSKVIVFPITIMLLLVAAILTYQPNATSIWAPPLLSGGGGAYGMAGIIGLGMILVIPTFVAGIQKSMKAEPAIPGGLGPIFGPLGQGVGSIMNIAYQGSFIAGAIRHKPDTRSPQQVIRQGAQGGFGTITGGGQTEGH
ncbi:MAG: hypothetical protein AAB492_02970 [Patescibacteria group bacterium]